MPFAPNRSIEGHQAALAARLNSTARERPSSRTDERIRTSAMLPHVRSD